MMQPEVAQRDHPLFSIVSRLFRQHYLASETYREALSNLVSPLHVILDFPQLCHYRLDLICNLNCYKPEQVYPSPVKPVSQVHVWLPLIVVQVALASQGLFRHPSMSVVICMQGNRSEIVNALSFHQCVCIRDFYCQCPAKEKNMVK